MGEGVSFKSSKAVEIRGKTGYRLADLLHAFEFALELSTNHGYQKHTLRRIVPPCRLLPVL